MANIVTFTVGIGLLVYMGLWAIHTQIIHRREFLPASRRFDDAKAAGDLDGMRKATKETAAAHEKSFDFFWWMRS